MWPPRPLTPTPAPLTCTRCGTVLTAQVRFCTCTWLAAAGCAHEGQQLGARMHAAAGFERSTPFLARVQEWGIMHAATAWRAAAGQRLGSCHSALQSPPGLPSPASLVSLCNPPEVAPAPPAASRRWPQPAAAGRPPPPSLTCSASGLPSAPPPHLLPALTLYVSLHQLSSGLFQPPPGRGPAGGWQGAQGRAARAGV